MRTEREVAPRLLSNRPNELDFETDTEQQALFEIANSTLVRSLCKHFRGVAKGVNRLLTELYYKGRIAHAKSFTEKYRGRG